MVWIEKDGQKEKKIKRRTCRFDTTIGTVFKFFVIMCFILLWVGCASAATLVVSKTSPACTSGDEYFTSIQAAVDRAQEGDEIVVCPGTYVENILVDKSLTIWSENGYDSTIVRTADTEDAVFEVTADYVAISGFTVEGATGWLKSGIYLYDSDYCKLSNNNCSNNGYGIYIESSNNL
jgi:parallel beta-helix repeat protein